MPSLFPEDNSAAARAAGLFSVGPDSDDYELPGTFAMTFRLPLKLAAYLAVMSDHADISRNEMAKLIVQAGVQEILARTPDAIRAEIEAALPDQVSQFTD
jgi:hypothetical protein